MKKITQNPEKRVKYKTSFRFSLTRGQASQDSFVQNDTNTKLFVRGFVLSFIYFCFIFNQACRLGGAKQVELMPC